MSSNHGSRFKVGTIYLFILHLKPLPTMVPCLCEICNHPDVCVQGLIPIWQVFEFVFSCILKELQSWGRFWRIWVAYAPPLASSKKGFSLDLCSLFWLSSSWAEAPCQCMPLRDGSPTWKDWLVLMESRKSEQPSIHRPACFWTEL